MIRLESPYDNACASWLRGNLHTHTTNTDGDRSPQDVVWAYAKLGYDFLMLSDHDHFTDPDPLDCHGMTLIPGYELTGGGVHMLHVGAREALDPDPDRQKVLDAIGRGGGFGIVCHPGWLEQFNHCDQSLLEAWRGYAGIEIANGVCFLAPGTPYALDRWDRLLASGRRVWGYANDDSHWARTDAMAWNVVQSADRSPGAILEALRTGRFYCSTGVEITRVTVDNHHIAVETANADRIVLMRDCQARLAVHDGPSAAFPITEEALAGATYLRIECMGRGEQTAWTQPVFIKRD